MRRNGVAVLVSVIGLVILLGGRLWWAHNRCLVTVVNASGATLERVRLQREAASDEIGALPPGTRRTTRIFPRGEDSVRLSFLGRDGREQQSPSAYVEATGGYRVRFRVTAQDAISVESRLGAWPLEGNR